MVDSKSNRNRLLLASAAALLLATGPWLGTALAVIDPPSQLQLAKGETEARRLVFLMDKDKNGKVSKQEFMAFMEAEFDRLDKDKSGELEVKEPTPPRVTGRPNR